MLGRQCRRRLMSSCAVESPEERIVRLLRRGELRQQSEAVAEQPQAVMAVLRKLPVAEPELASAFFAWTDLAGFPHTTFTSNWLLEVLLRAGRHRHACNIFQRELLPAALFDAYTYFLLVKAFCNAGEVQGAAQLLRDMAERGFVVSPRMHNLVLAGLCKAGRLSEALDAFRSTSSSQRDVVSYNTLVWGLCKAGRLEEAKQVLSGMGKDGQPAPNRISYNAIIHGLSAAGKPAEAELILHNLMLPSGACPDAVTFNSLVHGFCKQGELGRAGSILEAMKRSGCSPDAYSYAMLVDGLCKSGRVEAAAEVVEGMLAEGRSPSAAAFNALITGLCRASQVARARAVLGSMSKSGCAADVVTYTALMQGLCRQGKAEQAEEVMEEMMARLGRPPDAHCCAALVGGLCAAGRFGSAAAQVERMVERWGLRPAASTVAAVVDGLCRKRRRPHDARALLHRLCAGGALAAADVVALQTLLDGVEGGVLDRSAFEERKARG